MRYQTPHALRMALEHRLLTRSNESGVSLDRLCRRVLFERVVARLQVAEPGRWVLKGGMALEARLRDGARLTKDIDIGLRDDVVAAGQLHDRLIDALTADPDSDGFVIACGPPAPLREDGGGHVTWRLKIEAELAGKVFGGIQLDVSPRTHELAATDVLSLPNSLDFADIPPPWWRSSTCTAMLPRSSTPCSATSATARIHESGTSSTSSSLSSTTCSTRPSWLPRQTGLGRA